jgi:uncharacterized protein (DUF362 family)
MDRRTFVKSTCLGTAGFFIDGQASTAQQQESGATLPQAPPIEVHGLPQTKPSPLGMPGLYPGRVVEVVDRNSIVGNRVAQPVIRQMLEKGMRELTGEPSVPAAWSKFIEPADIVGIKINPSGAPACCSSPEIVREIINAVRSVEVPSKNIVVFDRYSYEIDIGGYQTLLPAGIGVLGIEDGVGDISGYDLDVYCEVNFFGEWETRSYMASVVAQNVTKIINVPTMKDHSAAGVTGCLKNLGYGVFNNVARSHRAPYSFTDPLIGLMCSTEPLRSKSVLHIMDGMREVWHGGPLTQVQDFIFQAGTLLIGTDPVAIDTIELETIEKKRKEEGAPSLWQHDAKSITANNMEFFHDASKNLFYRRPGHVASAAKLGLGVGDISKIDRRTMRLA